MIHLFAFTYNTETKEAAVIGNISTQFALQLLQQLTVQEAINKAMEEQKAAGQKSSKADKINKKEVKP